ncbi:MAG TPA: biopolymer transporter ExbD [Flavisolibacter sp.]|nr:biopolymer transporter ExbD [Flavisolibacter sp.]
MNRIETGIPGKKPQRLCAPHIDMTPMVDLGFLLITFFIFTTSMAENRSTSLFMPAEGKPTPVAASNAFTIILSGNDEVFYYQGAWEDALKTSGMGRSGYSPKGGIREEIQKCQQSMGTKKDKLMLLIKPLASASYENVVDALDEAMINNVQRYAIVEANAAEKEYIQNKLRH